MILNGVIKVMIILLLSLLVSAPDIAQASCVCKIKGRERAMKANNVFAAKFTSLTPSYATLEVTKNFKGETPYQLEIQQDEILCVHPLHRFELNKEYIFMVNSFSGEKGNRFKPSACVPAKVRSESKDLEKWMNSKEFKASAKK